MSASGPERSSDAAPAPYPSHPRPSRPWPRVGAPTALSAASVALALAWIGLGPHASPSVRLGGAVVAVVVHAFAVTVSRRAAATPDHAAPAPAPEPGDGHHRSALVRAIVLAGVLGAAVLPLHGSRDLFLYDVYGRTLAVHGENPYTTPPDALDDAVVPLVAEEWHDQRSLYGPVFLLVAAPASVVAGTDELTIRLVWQAVAAAAAVGIVCLVAHRGLGAVVLVGASPAFLAAVNGGHNDLLVGLGLVLATLSARRCRPVRAGLAASLAVLVKVTAVVPVVGLLWWLLVARGARTAAKAVAAVAAVVGVGYLVAGSAARAVLREESGDDSRYALWQPWREDRWNELLDAGVAFRPRLEQVRDEFATLALVAVAVLVVLVLVRFRRAPEPGEVATATGLVALLVATYTVPWYAGWSLPLAATVWRSRVALVAVAQAGLLLVAYSGPPGADPHTSVQQLLEQGGATAAQVALVVAVVAWAAVRDPSASSLASE